MPPRNNTLRGSALVVVMWVSLGLVSLALLFGHSMMLEYRAAENLAAGLQAEHAIDGARRYVGSVLENMETPGYLPDPEEDYESEALEIGDARVWLIGRAEGEGKLEDELTFGLTDEASRLNLNTATYEMLLQLPDMTETVAAAIIDWRDGNTETSNNTGAESDYYLTGDPAYYAKDAAFESLDELRLLRGVDEDLLIGEDYNRNGVLEPNEDDGDESVPDDDGDGTLSPGIFEYLTVYSREWNKRDDGSDRVNLRSNPQGLAQLLTEELGESRAQEILQSTGQNLGQVNSVLAYYLRSGMTPEEFAQVHDGLTVQDGDYIEGLVNVNTAPQAVLRCIPGIVSDYAATLAGQRLTLTDDQLLTIAWLKDVLPQENAVQAGPYLTARSYQFRADMAAVGREGAGFRRERVIFDTAGGEVKLVDRKDLSHLGWPLGADVRAELSEEDKAE